MSNSFHLARLLLSWSLAREDGLLLGLFLSLSVGISGFLAPSALSLGQLTHHCVVLGTEIPSWSSFSLPFRFYFMLVFI